MNLSKKGHVELSILEICLIAIAAVAVFILGIKFVVCRVMGNMRGHILLNQDLHRRSMTTDTMSTGIPNGNDPEKATLQLQKPKKKGLSAYWV